MKYRQRAIAGAAMMGLIATVAVSGSAAGEPSGEASIGYWTDTQAVIADSDGQEIGTFPNFEHFSFDGGVLAGELQGKRPYQRRIVGYEISSRQRLFRIPDARLPVATAGGERIAFLATATRERFTNSVWMRMATGRIRKIAMFSPGPGRPGIPHGMSFGGQPLDVAIDQRGRTVAVAFGLESLRAFDVWIIDVKTKAATRMTRGRNSHSPSLSPDGSSLAVRVESTETCPHDIYGEYFMGKIRVFSRDTGERKALTEFSCDLFYDTPRWIDNDSLLAVRIVRDDPQQFGFDLDVVKIDVATGAITELVSHGNPCCITVSPSLGKVAYEFTDIPGFSVFDLETSTAIDFPEGNYVPHLAGQNRF
jgi:hypothetical protein